jgi:hypothetical protein
MDYEFWWRVSEFFRFEYLPEVLAVQHRQPDSKTVLAWRKVLQERERIFSPFYPMVDGGDRAGLMQEKRRALARIFLDQAYSVAGSRKGRALGLLWSAVRERPGMLLGLSWAGILRRVVFP